MKKIILTGLCLMSGLSMLLPYKASGHSIDNGFLTRDLTALTYSPVMETYTGLWVGYAVVNKVSYVNEMDAIPQPTATEFTIRIIVHVDAAGNARLLNEVTQMWSDGSYQPDPEEEGKFILDQPGQYVLITDDALLSSYSGATIRDGQAVGRRISSPFFSFDEPQLLDGDFQENLTLNNLVLDYNDPVNPFKHQFHPDHNNKDERFEATLSEGVESYTVTRNLAFQFSEEDPENLSSSGWGENQVGGIYKESIQGIHRQSLEIEGYFRLRRVSSIGELNPSPASLIAEVTEPALLEAEKETIATAKMGKNNPFGQLSISPNPVTDDFQIQGLPYGENYQVSLIDNVGKTLTSFAYQANGIINTNQLIPGVYHLQIVQGGFLQNLKFVKQIP